MNTKNLAILSFALLAKPALALTVAGTIPPETGLQNLVSYGLLIAGWVICGFGLYHGGRSALDGRNWVHGAAGAGGGLLLAYGMPYFVTRYGVLG